MVLLPQQFNPGEIGNSKAFHGAGGAGERGKARKREVGERDLCPTKNPAPCGAFCWTIRFFSAGFPRCAESLFRQDLQEYWDYGFF
jgi:hypothetical protein